jgi:hypothetical protein
MYSITYYTQQRSATACQYNGLLQMTDYIVVIAKGCTLRSVEQQAAADVVAGS